MHPDAAQARSRLHHQHLVQRNSSLPGRLWALLRRALGPHFRLERLRLGHVIREIGQVLVSPENTVGDALRRRGGRLRRRGSEAAHEPGSALGGGESVLVSVERPVKVERILAGRDLARMRRKFLAGVEQVCCIRPPVPRLGSPGIDLHDFGTALEAAINGLIK